MLRHLSCVTLLLACAGAPALADTYPRQRHLDVDGYTFRLQLNDTTDEIVGQATIRVRVVEAGVPALQLDLASTTPARQGRGMTVTATRVNGQPSTFTHQADALRIALPATVAADALLDVDVDYRGTPATGLLIANNKHGDRTFFADNWPTKAREWLPVVDHPSDKATSEFLVDAPSHYQVVSNGLLVEETDLEGGRRLTHWKQSVPISPWLYVLGVAPFAVQRVGDFEGRPVQTWVYRQDRDAGFHDFAVPTVEVLDFFDRRVGPYAYEKLANVQANGVRGGMESATAIFYGDDSVTGSRSLRWRNVVIHEIAHQWFGNAVTERDWDDVWLSEGFATYFTLLFIEHAYGHDEFLAGVRHSRDMVRTFEQKNPGYRVVHDNLSDMARVTTSQTYQKGAWVLHMLRGLIGDEAFWQGIRTYYRTYFNGTASTDQFRRIMEQASGRDLGWFFDQWLRRGGWATVNGTWRYDAATRAVIVDLSQRSSDGAAFRLPMEIALQVAGEQAPRVQRVELTGTSGVFTIPSPQAPDAVLLDPGTWVLMDATLTAGQR